MISASKVARNLGIGALILYLGSFALPDQWVRLGFRYPLSRGPGAVAQTHDVHGLYFFPEMMACFSSGRGGPSLDWPGWVGHAAVLTGFGLLVARRGRLAVAAAAAALVFGLLRVVFAQGFGFLAGYYVWLGSMVVLGLAGYWQFRASRAVEAASDSSGLDEPTLPAADDPAPGGQAIGPAAGRPESR